MRRKDRDLYADTGRPRMGGPFSFRIADCGMRISMAQRSRVNLKSESLEIPNPKSEFPNAKSVSIVHLRHEFGESRVVAEGIETLVVLEVRFVLIAELDRPVEPFEGEVFVAEEGVA